jgi:hypothetical protein
MGVAPGVGGARRGLRTVAFVGEPPAARNPAQERDVTQNDPEAPGPAAPGTTPGTDANTADIVATGDDRVDQALRRLGELADLPLPGHAAVFEHIHAELTGALGTLESGNDQFPRHPIASAQIPPAAAAHGTPATPDS